MRCQSATSRLERNRYPRSAMAHDREVPSIDLRGLLAAAENARPVDAADVVGRALREAVEAHHVSLLITNFSGTALVRLSHVSAHAVTEDGANERVEELPLPGSVYEQSMSRQETNIVQQDHGWLVLSPITERGDAIGLLEARFDATPTDDIVRSMAGAAHALAYVLIAARRHTDLFEWAQRDVAFTLAAEMQRRLLPSAYTLEAGPFTLAGWLEPAHSVGGDTFDYSLDREFLYLSMTDAMGHGVEAALLATVVLGSLRNSRRRGATPVEQANAANAALLANARPEQFVTGQILRVSLADGVVDFVNAGHPPPYFIRDGRAVEAVVGPPQLALGIRSGTYESQTAVLEPGDRLVLVTDGYLERNALRLDLSEMLRASADKHPREVVRELAGQVLEATDRQLLDDATVLCIDWYGDRRRKAYNGADIGGATQADSN